jgi:hypothetical protein
MKKDYEMKKFSGGFTFFSFLLLLQSCGMNLSSINSQDQASIDVSGSSFLLAMSADLLAPLIARQMSEKIESEETREQTFFSTIGTVTTSSEIDLVKSNNRIAIDSLVTANFDTRVNGRASRSGVAVDWDMSSMVNTTSRMALRIDLDKGAYSPATRTNHNSQLKITAVRAEAGGLFRQTKERKARQKVYQNKNKMQRNIATKVVGQTKEKLDEIAVESIQTDGFQSLVSLSQTFAGMGPYASKYSLSTTEQQIRFALLMDQDDVPQVGEKADLAVRFKDQVMNNLFKEKYGAKTINSQDLRESLGGLLGDAGEQDPAESAEPEVESSITFASENPIHFNAEGGILEITINGDKFGSDGDEFAYPMEIKATYEVRGSSLIRLGELRILPPGFEEGSSTMSRRQKLLIDELDYSFGEIFKPVLIDETTHLKGKLAVAGVLNTKQLVAQDGWFLFSAEF